MAKKISKDSNISQNKTRTRIIYYGIGLLGGTILLYIFSIMNKQPEPTPTKYFFTKHGTLQFKDQNNFVKKSIDLEIADSEYSRQLGLMFRNEMKEDEGMLFIFPREDYLSFWMRNTLLPLDILFVNKNKEIVTIHTYTTPFSEQSFPADTLAQYVVEVNAGFTGKFNIKEGDKIDWNDNR